MAQSPLSAPSMRRKRKPLDLIRIKSLIVLVAGVFTALGGAFTGLGAQVAFAPMLTWMLGFGAEKAQATALRFAAFASVSAVFGAYASYQLGSRQTMAAQMSTEFSSERFWPWGLMGSGVLLFLGATVGAILTARFTPDVDQLGKKRFFQTLGVAFSLFVIAESRLLVLSGGTHYALWHGFPSISWLALILLGMAAGGLTQILGLSSGVLMVPALYFAAGFTAVQATSLSLFVIVLASLLPAWSYSKRGLVDTTYSSAAAIGGIFGGLAGGLLIGHLSSLVIMTLFGGITMFLSARELARIASEKPAPQ